MNPKSDNMSTVDLLVEPLLKIKRISNAATEIIEQDSISCLAVHEKFMVIGTDWGNIHILDHLGNRCKRMINAHSTVINQISIDSEGEYLASCSDDGKAIVFGLLDDKHLMVTSFNRKINAVAIAPDFKRSYNFVVGDSQLILISKSIIKNHKMKILQEYRSKIKNMKWRCDTLVYATDDSVYVYDMKEQNLLGIIEPTKSHLVPNIRDLYCRIFWVDNETFLIGWGHLVQMFSVLERWHGSFNSGSHVQQNKSAASSSSHNKVVESVYSFVHPDQVLGIVNFNKWILSVVNPVSESSINLVQNSSAVDETLNKMLILILEPVNTNPYNFIEKTADGIKIQGDPISKNHRTHLEKLPGENEFFLAFPKYLLSVQERNTDDRIKWFIDNHLYTRALDLIKTTTPHETKYNYKTVGMDYMIYLLEKKKEFKEAAKICRTIVSDTESWEKVIKVFLNFNAIEFLLKDIPINEDNRLNPDTYKAIMCQCYQNLPVFLRLLKMWPCSLYSIPEIFKLITGSEKYRQNNDSGLNDLDSREKMILECLAILHENNKDYRKSLENYMTIKSPYVFELIPKRNLFEIFKEKLTFFITYDQQKTLNLLIQYISYLQPDTIVKILQPTPYLLFYYLAELKSKNPTASEPYHSQLVHLYASCEKDKLLSFLKSSSKYDLNTAYNLCKEKNLTEQQIYLLGRIGKSKEALEMRMSQPNGIYPAIKYCQEQNDRDLWDQLTQNSLNKPDDIRAILETTTEEIDTKLFIKQILTSSTVEVPGLKSSLIRLLINNEKRSNLLASHQTARWRDLHEMLNQQLVCAAQPIIVEMDASQSINTLCLLCSKPMMHCTDSFQVLNCGHFCHTSCLDSTLNSTQLSINKSTGVNLNLKIINESDKSIVQCAICTNLI